MPSGPAIACSSGQRSVTQRAIGAIVCSLACRDVPGPTGAGPGGKGAGPRGRGGWREGAGPRGKGAGPGGKGVGGTGAGPRGTGPAQVGNGNCPVPGMRPGVGRSAARPVSRAGTRMDPPSSVPLPNAAVPEATAAASPPLDPSRPLADRAERLAEQAVSGVDGQPELGAVGLAEQDGSRSGEPLHSGRSPGWHVVPQHQAPRAVDRTPRVAIRSFTGEGDAGQRSWIGARGDRSVDPRGLSPCLILGECDDRVERAVLSRTCSRWAWSTSVAVISRGGPARRCPGRPRSPAVRRLPPPLPSALVWRAVFPRDRPDRGPARVRHGQREAAEPHPPAGQAGRGWPGPR